jgi:hypothetical protein
MNRIKVTTGIILFALSAVAAAQTPQLTSLAELSSFMRSDYNYIEEQRARNAMVEGSPYLEEEFTGGSLIFRDTPITRTCCCGIISTKAILNSNLMTRCSILIPDTQKWTQSGSGKRSLFSRSTWMEKHAKRSYMQLQYEGDTTQALVLLETILLPPEKAAGYEDAKPARFQPRTDRLFVRFSRKSGP